MVFALGVIMTLRVALRWLLMMMVSMLICCRRVDISSLLVMLRRVADMHMVPVGPLMVGQERGDIVKKCDDLSI